LGPIDRANLYLWTLESTPHRVYKPSAGVKANIKNSTYMRPSTCGQSPQDQSIIKIEVNTKKTNFKRRKYYKINERA
jgi:hypothetical protein